MNNNMNEVKNKEELKGKEELKNKAELKVKEVDLFGDTVIAAQDENGVIWAGVNWFCRGLGLSKNERDRQVKNIQSDEVLKRGCVKFDAGVFEANNATLALQLDYIPLWLTKISITPNMKKNNPELVDKLIKYQLNAKDVLAAAFLPKMSELSDIIDDLFGDFNKGSRDVNNTTNTKTNASNAAHNAAYNTTAHSTSYTDLSTFDVPNVLDFHGTEVITTAELAAHYETRDTGILQMFYKNKKYFKEGMHYFSLESDEEIDFRKENGLNTATKIYLWTRIGSLLFTKLANTSVGWMQYKRMLNILLNDVTDDVIENQRKEITTVNNVQIPENTNKFTAQNKWNLRNEYKIKRICQALNVEEKEFKHMIILKIQEIYNMKSVETIYKNENGCIPKNAMDIIDYFPELAEIADNVLAEYMLSIVDRFVLLKDMAAAK